MDGFVQFALLGLGSAAINVLLASGAIVIYRGSGVVNFAQGSFAVAGGYAYYDATRNGLPVPLAVLIAVATAGLCGLITELAVMWPMRKSSPLTRIVATLAVVIVISNAVLLRYGDNTAFTEPVLPHNSVHFGGSIVVPADRIWLLGISLLITVVLWAGYRWTRFGVATSAVAENQDAVAALGWSPRAIAACNWTIGACLAGGAGVVFVTLNGVSQDALSLAIIPALSAALVGGFASFPLTLAGAVIVGIIQSETTRYVQTPGWGIVGPFIVIVIILMVRNRSLPERSFLSDRLPKVGTGRIRPVGAITGLAAAIGSCYVFGSAWSQALTLTAVSAIICLGLVVVTGYAGQISLTQFALAGVGALISSRFAAVAGIPFVPAVLLGIVITVPISVLVALPALRARGLNLAVVTLGLASVIDTAVLTNVNWTGGLSGTQLKSPALFGLNVGGTADPARYATVCLVACALTALLVANIRHGRTGRRLLAVRENERAAASLGIGTFAPKLYAFGVAGGISALAGGLIAFQYNFVDFTQFSPQVDMNYVMLIVIGGLGYVAGSVNAGVLVTAGVGQVIVERWVSVSNTWELIVGLFLLVQLIFTPDGLARPQVETVARVAARLRPTRPAPSPAADVHAVPPLTVPPRVLELRDVVVEFGGTRALDGLSLSVHPGEVVGLIGPNGAGKTTLIDAATGFARVRSGEILLDGKPVNGLTPQRRARRGLSRSWQSQELFAAMTVEENLRAASERGGALAYLLEPLWPRRVPLADAVRAGVEQLELGRTLSCYPDDLPYATRRLVGIGRAIAAAPSVLLLDEPTAGLDESSTREFGELIRRLARDSGMGILLVEHDVSLVMKTCDRVVAVSFGREIASGPPQQIRRHQEVIAAYLGQRDALPDQAVRSPGQ